MKFTDSIWINTSSRKVWESVGSLDAWPRFFAKKGKCERVSPEGGIVGSLYGMELGVGLSAIGVYGQIVDLHPGKMIAVKMKLDETDQPMSRDWTTTITYALTEEGFGTRVVERIHMSDFDSHINWAVKIFGWLIYRFRRMIGKTNLQRLKRLVEGSR